MSILPKVMEQMRFILRLATSEIIVPFGKV